LQGQRLHQEAQQQQQQQQQLEQVQVRLERLELYQGMETLYYEGVVADKFGEVRLTY